MAKKHVTTNSKRRPQPAKRLIPWANRDIPDKPARQRAMLREIARTVDDEAIRSILWWALSNASESDTRADLAELARIKATCAIIPAKKVPLSELVPIKRKAHRKAVRP